MAALGSDLANGVVIDLYGTLYCACYADGSVYCEHSLDGGASQATWIVGGTRTEICAPGEEVAPALCALTSGELVAAVQIDEAITVYLSRDQGESWEEVGAV